MRLPPLWSTNVNYSSGPDAGSITKIDPGSSDNGFIRGVVAAPQHVNFLFHAMAAAVRRSVTNAALKLREIEAAINDAQNFLAAVSSRTADGAPVVIKSGSNDTVWVWDLSLGDAEGTVASITSQVCGAARNGPSGTRIVAIGTGGNRCCFSTDEGTNWSAGSDLTATPQDIVYNVVHANFMVTFLAGVNVARDVDGASTWVAFSSGLTSAQGGIAVLANGDTVVCGLDGSSDVDFAVSSDGGATYSVAGGTVPNAADYDDSGWVCGNGGATVFHAGRLNAGVNLRICSSANGTVWAQLAQFTAPGGATYNAKPRILMCQTTGLLVATSVLSTGAGIAYASVDGGLTWTEPMLYASGGGIPATAWGVANGRVFATLGTRLFASDGIGSE